MIPISLNGNDQHVGNRSLVFAIGIFALTATLLTSACGKTEQAPAPKPQTVEVTEVIQKDVPIQQEWIGTLDGMVNAQILAQVSGYLIKQHYQEGQLVKKGQLLYEIEPNIFQAALDGALSNLAQQEAILKTNQLDLNRVERLLPERAVSVRDRDNAVGRFTSAQAEVLAAKSSVESARLQLGFTKITSPIDGLAGISKAQLGNLVGPGSTTTELTTISQLDPIKAYIPLSEQQYLQFARSTKNEDQYRDSQPIQLILADGSVYPQPGKFFFANRQVNIKTGTIQVAMLFPNPDNLLRPGQYARIRAAVTHKADALLIPQRAVKETQGKQQVAVVKPDNSVELRSVKVAETVGTLWVIEEGLQPGERVIVEGIQKVKSGDIVEPIPYTGLSTTTTTTAGR
jgi:membrane fusion protein (multidrug efflux system)